MQGEGNVTDCPYWNNLVGTRGFEPPTPDTP